MNKIMEPECTAFPRATCGVAGVPSVARRGARDEDGEVMGADPKAPF